MQANVLTHGSQMVYIRQGSSFFKAHSTWKAATSASSNTNVVTCSRHSGIR